MKLWFAPQISEHWPKKIPGRIIIKFNWFSRPGMASTLTPNLGIVQEWRTSAADTIKRIWEFKGRTRCVSTSRSRILFIMWGVDWSMKESNSRFKKSEYS